MKGRQGRFLGITVGGWIAARAWLLWPATPLALGGTMMTAGLVDGPDRPAFAPAANFQPLRLPGLAARHSSPARAVANDVPSSTFETARERHGRAMLLSFDAGFGTVPQRLLRYAVYADRAPAPPPVAPSVVAPPTPVPRGGRAIEGQAYLFVRPGSGRAALAPGGSLGGSQAAARVAVALNRDGPVRTAIAARLYAPLRSEGAEAAVGLDWHPLAGVPLRLSVERRIGLDHAGRNAWSAYAAGGFFTGGLPLGLEADGYAQAGVVGARSRDLFADGALRVGRRIALGKADAVVGAGTWGAAQPGATRFDIGPRLAVSLPVERHRLTLAAEGRFRVAGRASPGSGAALTLTADF